MELFIVVSILCVGALLLRALVRRSARRMDVPAESPGGFRSVGLRSGRTVDVVGESHYQHNLERVAGRRTRDSKRVEKIAVLWPEPSNPYDSNAVAVYIDGLQVGHLMREDAQDYQPVLLRMHQRGEIAQCMATIVGGWSRGRHDRGSFGVKLNLAPANAVLPEALMVDEVAARLRVAAGPAARRRELAQGLRFMESPQHRQALLLRASTIEVEAVLEKVAGLKTPAVKRRRLQEALDALRADAVPDELQTQQVAWLEAALRDLDGQRVAAEGIRTDE